MGQEDKTASSDLLSQVYSLTELDGTSEIKLLEFGHDLGLKGPLIIGLSSLVHSFLDHLVFSPRSSVLQPISKMSPFPFLHLHRRQGPEERANQSQGCSTTKESHLFSWLPPHSTPVSQNSIGLLSLGRGTKAFHSSPHSDKDLWSRGSV